MTNPSKFLGLRATFHLHLVGLVLVSTFVLKSFTGSAESAAQETPAKTEAAAETEKAQSPDASAKKKPAAPSISPETLAGQVKQIFRTRCFECHGGRSTQEGIRILERELLVNAKKVVIAGEPDQSILYQRLTASDGSEMPPEGQPRPSAEEIATVRQWIASGAPAFPEDVGVPPSPLQDPALRDVVGVDYVLGKILAHVRTMPRHARPFQRYFSTNHLLTAGATRQELDIERDALAKVINHLSWEPEIVPLKCIDEPTGTIFCLDIREVGWDKRPFKEQASSGTAQPSSLNLFDLALLEYPYGVIYEDSNTYDQLAQEYLTLAQPVRPILYVRADWFTSVASQFPLYEDFLQLPFSQDELERLLEVKSDRDGAPAEDAQRAGMTVSGVSRNNRVVQRQPAKYGAYWKSYDFAGSKGIGNMFRDPIHLHPAGGEMIFTLPNGLQGYYVSTAVGKRLEAAPTEIVTDKFAEDKTVRNALSCMRCHERGMKNFHDTIRPALQRLPGSAGFDKRVILGLYPEQTVMDGYLEQDTERFMSATAKALGHQQQQEPITPVSRRFIDAPLQFSLASAELGMANSDGLEHLFKTPQFASLGLVPLASQGVVRRDMWEDYFDQVVRGLGIGVPIAPLDGLQRPDYPSANPPFAVTLATTKPNNVFAPGDELAVVVTNQSDKPLYIELVGTSAEGKQVILTKPGLIVGPKQKYRFPQEGSIKVKPSVGKERITLFASDQSLPPGKLMRGDGLTDRVLHDFYSARPVVNSGAPGNTVAPTARSSARFDPARLVKKSIEIETK